MHVKLGIVAAGLLFATPVFSQNYNGFVPEPAYNFESTTMSWAYGPNGSRSSATQVLAQLRARCSSDHHYDQYFCARGMKVLRKAHAEYKLRMAAKNSAVQ